MNHDSLLPAASTTHTAWSHCYHIFRIFYIWISARSCDEYCSSLFLRKCQIVIDEHWDIVLLQVSSARSVLDDIGNANCSYHRGDTLNCEFAFYYFDDYRGILDDNLSCHCGRPSWRRIEGKDPWDSSFLKLRCARGACDYSNREHDQDGQYMTIPRAEIPERIRFGEL